MRWLVAGCWKPNTSWDSLRPYRYLNLQRYQREIHTDEARQLSREIARECQVLLKNEANVLPLSKSAKIALVGPFAVAAKEMQGSWSFSRFADGCVTFWKVCKKL